MANKKQQTHLSGTTCVNCGRRHVSIKLRLNDGGPLLSSQLVFQSSETRVKKPDGEYQLEFCTSACLHEWVDKHIGED